jgi:hypothetical protein
MAKRQREQKKMEKRRAKEQKKLLRKAIKNGTAEAPTPEEEPGSAEEPIQE